MMLASRLVLRTMAASLLYLRLAILGWGRIYLVLFSPNADCRCLWPGEREDRANRWILAVFALIELNSVSSEVSARLIAAGEHSRMIVGVYWDNG